MVEIPGVDKSLYHWKHDRQILATLSVLLSVGIAFLPQAIADTIVTI